MAKGKELIPNSLKIHRELMGYKQSDVAELLGLSNTAMISRWEKGVTMPGGINLLKLSKLYRTLVNELYFEFSKQLATELYPDIPSKNSDP